jgi:hypothetical protein
MQPCGNRAKAAKYAASHHQMRHAHPSLASRLFRQPVFFRISVLLVSAIP